MNSLKSFHRITVIALVLLSGAVFCKVNAQIAPVYGNPAPSAFPSGAIRVGVMLPKFTSNGQDATNAETVRTQIASYLQSPGVEVVLLGARVPLQAQLEAQQLGCGYILFTTVEKKSAKKGGFGDVFGKITDVVGKVDLPGVSGLKQTTTKGEINKASGTAAALAGLIKEKDEVNFQYQLAATSTLQFISNSKLNAKAAATGQDVISALIEKAVGEFLPKMFELTPPKTMNTPTGVPQIRSQSQNQFQPQYPEIPAALAKPFSNSSDNRSGAASNLNFHATAFNASVTSISIQQFRLGMLFEEVKATGKVQTSTKYEPDKFGYFDCATRCYPYNMQFLDGRLVAFTIPYSGVKWKDNKEFNSAIAQNLGLSDNWTKDGSIYYQKLSGYILSASTSGKSSWITIVNSAFGAEVKSRRERNESQKKSADESSNDQKKDVWKP